MSCNGCRVLRKGCSETCVLRPCLQWIESPEAQGHATVFVAKFFGRAGLMSFISAVPEDQRPALFQSLLFEAAGRTVNPVNGAVGLLWTGNWHVCQAAVETVLLGGVLKPIPGGDASDFTNLLKIQDFSKKRRRFAVTVEDRVSKNVTQLDADLDLSLTPRGKTKNFTTSPNLAEKRRRAGSPSMNSEESDTTTCGDNCQQPEEIKLLILFN